MLFLSMMEDLKLDLSLLEFKGVKYFNDPIEFMLI